MVKRLYLILLASVWLSSCGGDDDAPSSASDIEQWLLEQGISANEANGVFYYADSLNAAGTAVQNGSIVAIYYALFDLDDTLLASRQKSSRDSLLGKVGVGAIFPIGLDQSLPLMRTGEVYNFLLPPGRGYGQLTSGAIPAEESLRLQVELVAVFSENDIFTAESQSINSFINNNNLNDTTINPVDPVEVFSSGLAYKRRAVGTGPEPINGDTLLFSYQAGIINGSVFESRTDFEYVFGSDFPRELIPGLDFAMGRMQVNELALVLIPSSQAYRESVLVIPSTIARDLVTEAVIPEYAQQVEPYSTLSFEIRRVD